MADLKAPAAALLLLGAAYYYRRQISNQAQELGIFDQVETSDQVEPENTGSTWADEITATLFEAKNLFAPTPAAGMKTSAAGLDHIAQFEGLSLTPYRLGDGGYTLGRGRYFPDSGPRPPDRIDLATADAWFAEDVATKGERWVKAYVSVDLTQPQFDALVSMAFNLSPKSFKTIADQVNAGQDPEAAALRFVRAGTNLERGLRRRRSAELALYRTDPSLYA